jgi:uncharacterized protein YggT (Ycf19 family)
MGEIQEIVDTHRVDAPPIEIVPTHQYALARITQVTWIIVGMIEILIASRIVLKTMAANSTAGFAQFIYGTSALFLAPFRGLVHTPQAGASVFETSSLIAMVVYVFLGWGLIRLMWVFFDPKR